MPKANDEPFILAVLDIVDVVENDSISFSMVSPNTCLNWLVIDVLKKINDIPERGKVLLSCFEQSQGISIIERILLNEEHKREKLESDFLLADEDFTTLKMEFVKRLDELSIRSPHELLQHRHLISFLYGWQRWGECEKVCSWLREQISKPESCIQVLSAFISKSSSWGSNDYVAKVTKNIPLKNIEDFVSIDEIIEITRVIDVSTLNNEDQEVLTLFNSALERRMNGDTEQW